MCNVSIAKDRVKILTSKLERDLYLLKYGKKDHITLNNESYKKLKKIYNEDSSGKLTFPFKKVKGNIYLDGSDEKLYKSLHILAEKFDIILDYLDLKKVY